jgi:HlyD family secretion protein
MNASVNSMVPGRRVSFLRRALSLVLLVGLLAAAAALGIAYGDHWRGRAGEVPKTPTPASDATRAAQGRAPSGARFGHVHALGRLEPKGRLIRLAPPAGQESARVQSLRVAEGDLVQEGAVLARLDNWNRRQAAVAEAEAARAAAEARLAQTKAGAKPAEIAAQKEQVELLAQQIRVERRDRDRAQLLVGKKALPTEEFEDKQWAFDRIVLEHRRAEHQLEALSQVRETDVLVRERELASAEAVLATARTNLAEAELLAPSTGRVLKIHSRPGEKVAEKGILELGDVDHMEAVAEVFEGDVSRLAVGQSAEVLIDGTGETLSGTVVELGHIVGRKVVLSNDPVSDTDARILEVRVALAPADALRVARLSNARVEVRIAVGTR